MIDVHVSELYLLSDSVPACMHVHNTVSKCVHSTCARASDMAACMANLASAACFSFFRCSLAIDAVICTPGRGSTPPLPPPPGQLAETLCTAACTAAADMMAELGVAGIRAEAAAACNNL